MFFFVKIDSQIGALSKNKTHSYDGKIDKSPSSVKRFDRIVMDVLSKCPLSNLSVETYCKCCSFDVESLILASHSKSFVEIYCKLRKLESEDFPK